MESYYRYWGKADPAYLGNPKWHPLVYHCLDVAAVAAGWLDASPVVRRIFLHAFGGNEVEIRAWVLFFTALHDIGKFDLRFQRKADATLKEAWPEIDLVDIADDQAKRFDHGRWGFIWGINECPAWTGPTELFELLDAWRPWLAAVTGHHGDLPEGGDADCEYAEAPLMAHDREARREWVAVLAKIFLEPVGISLSTLPPLCDRASQALLAGFCAVSDWTGSNTEVSPYANLDLALNLDKYLARRVDEIQRQEWVIRFGLIRVARDYRGLAKLLKPGESPRGLQVCVDELSCVPGLILIEAPTGSGKTEVALAHAWRLLSAGVADSIVFALPTQATANAMLKRAEDFAEKAFQGTSANVVLAHGKRELSPEFERLVNAGQRYTAQQGEEASAQCSIWLAQSRKRVFLGQIGVCTVDQTLLSVLPVRHKFVRGFGLYKAVLIVDEVHAYDAYMYGLLTELLRRQKAIGGSAILLSATLPVDVRAKLLEAWDVEAPNDAVYPVIWEAGENGARFVEAPAEQQPRCREVFIESLTLPEAMPDDPLLARIVAAAEAGARVAVVVNLVDVAQRVVRQLRKRTTLPVDIFHARYRFTDRQTKEQAVLQYYGRNAVRDGGRILVATQVVEQSLDLDFDWMLTQICPVDLLFQRLGRLHRHERTRPNGFEMTLCTVMTVDGSDYGLHKLIYGNARVLWRTDKLLSATDRIVFPRAYRRWIEVVYKDKEWKNEPESVTKDYNDFLGRQIAAACEAKMMITTPRKPFGDDDMSITVKTRDGEMSLTVLSIRADGCLLGGERLGELDERAQAMAIDFNTVPVPDSWKNSLADIGLDEDGRYRLIFTPDEGGSWVARSGSTTFVYSEEFGLERRKKDESAH